MEEGMVGLEGMMRQGVIACFKIDKNDTNTIKQYWKPKTNAK